MQRNDWWWFAPLALALACSPSGKRSVMLERAAGSGQPVAASGASPAFSGFDEGDIGLVMDEAIGASDACLTETREAEQFGLDMLVMLDSSGSMAQQLPQSAAAAGATKWDAVREALAAFVLAEDSRELGVGLQYFPQRQTACDEPLGLCADLSRVCSPSSPCPSTSGPCLPLGSGCLTDESCDVQLYTTPAVAISSAPERGADIVASLEATVPSGDTPTGPALSGALAHAQAWALEHPERQVVTVLATDGFPTICTPLEIPELAVLSLEAAQGPRPIKTFVVGVFSEADLGRDGQARLDELAQAGGTERAFLIETGGNVSAELLAALETIRLSAVGCEFGLQAGAALDFERVNLKLSRDGAGAQLFNADDAAGCERTANGWYYVRDAAGTPTRIEVCPEVCATLRQGTARLDLQVGCATLIR